MGLGLGLGLRLRLALTCESPMPALETRLPPRHKVVSSVAAPEASALMSSCAPASVSRLKARSSDSRQHSDECSASMSGCRCACPG